MKPVVETLMKEHLMILERGAVPSELIHIVPALMEGGIKVFEVTFSPADPECTKHGMEAIAASVKAAEGNMIVGAGTVLSAEQVRAAADAGAQFIVAPCCDPEVVEEAKKLNLAMIPGAMTPTEIVLAWKQGVDMVKLFPADGMGMPYIRNLRGPLPHIPLLATGGVNPDTIPEFLEHGINAVGTGVTVVKRELVESCNWREITRLAELHVSAVRKACEAHD